MSRVMRLESTPGHRRTIPRRPAGEPIPLSFGQEQIWLHSQLAPDLPLYSESLTIRRNGPVDPEALIGAFREIVRRHEIWRTTLVWSHDRLTQLVHADREPRVRVADLRHLPFAGREPAALRLAAGDLGEPFDLSREPGVRAWLVTLSDADHRLYLCLHHVVFDGISIYRVFLPELASLYDAQLGSTPFRAEEPPLQYGDFAHWQRHSVREAELEPLAQYWKRQLAGAPYTIAFRAARPRPRRQTFRGGLVRFGLPSELTAAVRSTARQESCTPFMVLLAGFAATLHRWSGQTDMLIGSVSGGRDLPELQHLIGYFLRILIFRADLRGNPTFREILSRVRGMVVDALSHDAIPFQRLVQAVGPCRDLSRSPLFQVTFSIEPTLPALAPGWDITEMDGGTTVSKFDLSIELEDRGEVITGRAIYSLDLFEAATIAELLADYTMVLRKATGDRGRHLNDMVGLC